MSTPVWVQVLWSESGKFKDNELIPFNDFEIRAFRVAMMHDIEGGYYKTKVNVLFDDGSNYKCRLDLAPNDTLDFRDHAHQLISWYERQGNGSEHYAENYNFLKGVIWSEAA